ncbi:hypothetical protein G3I60_20125 [Streptomyces sp. SID13666]|uniref:hypothetical protein n=1 Tax=Streptomyces sp. SID13666 TaxID=2706054 RepID=UPI0013BEF42D|nr:hypothetical protein [Streptomyces sp. SID13666]NEA56389.1 hypothetical protein [Streptomyces sp. SID13666]
MNVTQQEFSHLPTSREVGEPTKPQVVKYTTHLPASLIKWLKREALDRDMKDYQLMQLALESFQRSQGGTA